MNKQGHKFNRMWYDSYEWQETEDKYIPSYEREGFDESKVIRLDYKGDKIDDDTELS